MSEKLEILVNDTSSTVSVGSRKFRFVRLFLLTKLRLVNGTSTALTQFIRKSTLITSSRSSVIRVGRSTVSSQRSVRRLKGVVSSILRGVWLTFRFNNPVRVEMPERLVSSELLIVKFLSVGMVVDTSVRLGLSILSPVKLLVSTSHDSVLMRSDCKFG